MQEEKKVKFSSKFSPVKVLENSFMKKNISHLSDIMYTFYVVPSGTSSENGYT